jgi:hypothetical protein
MDGEFESGGDVTRCDILADLDSHVVCAQWHVLWDNFLSNEIYPEAGC